MVCGAAPGQSLFASRAQIADGFRGILHHARACGVKLGIEPLHPMYADSRSAINTMRQAIDMSVGLADHLGVTADVFHIWWDDHLKADIARCGREKKLFSFHICDWKNQPSDMLNDRGLMGEGVIKVREIRGWVEDTGFHGFHEVEIFSNRYWAMDQDEYLKLIIEAYSQRKILSPHRCESQNHSYERTQSRHHHERRHRTHGHQPTPDPLHRRHHQAGRRPRQRRAKPSCPTRSWSAAAKTS